MIQMSTQVLYTNWFLIITPASAKLKGGYTAGLPQSGKSQGNSSLSQCQGKVREFCLWSLSMHIFHCLANDIWTRTKSSIMSSFNYHSPKYFFWTLFVSLFCLMFGTRYWQCSCADLSDRVGGCERVFTPIRWRQVRLSCIKWRSTFLYFFVRPSFGRQFVLRVDGCCANCVVGLAFLPSGHMTRKQRHYDVRNVAVTTSCARWVVLWGRPVSLV